MCEFLFGEIIMVYNIVKMLGITVLSFIVLFIILMMVIIFTSKPLYFSIPAGMIASLVLWFDYVIISNINDM